mmetsp:Transcript_33908/g.79387  ORF Transcript_33908/g.79387 Transcript_33908/m.79387 type:complete len:245 (+) Transcript_33908:1638-2372(+)
MPFRAALRRREGHRDAEGEGHAEHRLRHRQHAFGERVGDGHRQRREAQQDGRRVGGQHQAEGQQRQRRAQQQGLPGRHRAGRHRALGGALDVAVEVAVGHVVDAAAGRAHQHRAQREHRQQMPAGEAVGRDPQRRQRGPEQQQPAGRPVPADELQVQAQPGGLGRAGSGGSGEGHAAIFTRRRGDDPVQAGPGLPAYSRRPRLGSAHEDAQRLPHHEEVARPPPRPPAALLAAHAQWREGEHPA